MRRTLNSIARTSANGMTLSRVFATKRDVNVNVKKTPTTMPLGDTESKINWRSSMPNKPLLTPPPNRATTSSELLTDVEIAVSKIFPAGFCWQLFSSIAENQGLHSSSLGFYALTGLGDAIGVGAGHLFYHSLKRPTVRFANSRVGTDWKEPDFDKDIKISAWLSCAAFASGGLWQPTVNVLSMVSSDALLMGPITGIACGSIFLGGLRSGRRVFDLQPNYQNAKDDAVLSCKVAGGTGLFVTTVTGLQNNVFEGLLGITENMPPLDACMTAGSSTLMGFLAVAGLTNAVKRAYHFTRPPSGSVTITKTGVADNNVKMRTVMPK